jgi:cytochrome o ubiquinol oxidase operon protein cyoD
MQTPPDHNPDKEKGSLKTYAVAFILSIGLTAVAFTLAGLSGGLSKGVVLVGILAAAIVQILVQLRFFLHLGTGPSVRWNVLSLVVTLVIMLLFVGGSLWIMANLNSRMM